MIFGPKNNSQWEISRTNQLRYDRHSLPAISRAPTLHHQQMVPLYLPPSIIAHLESCQRWYPQCRNSRLLRIHAGRVGPNRHLHPQRPRRPLLDEQEAGSHPRAHQGKAADQENCRNLPTNLVHRYSYVAKARKTDRASKWARCRIRRTSWKIRKRS